jgi:3-hydroxyacyl-[acyl-carrier-protein] dehydratase
MEPENIYTVETFQSSGDEVRATVIFNENHPLFEGHFPGNPIVPGVVQVQIIKDLAERHSGTTLILAHGKNIKFLSILSPAVNPKVEISLHVGTASAEGLPVQASIHRDMITFMKFSGIYTTTTR